MDGRHKGGHDGIGEFMLKGPMDKKRAQRDIAIEHDKRHERDVQGFIARNRDALNASIRKSRAEIARGKVSKKSMNDIIAEGRKQHFEEFEAAVREGLAEADAGKSIPYAEIRKWLLSWGTRQDRS